MSSKMLDIFAIINREDITKEELKDLTIDDAREIYFRSPLASILEMKVLNHLCLLQTQQMMCEASKKIL